MTRNPLKKSMKRNQRLEFDRLRPFRCVQQATNRIFVVQARDLEHARNRAAEEFGTVEGVLVESIE